MKRIGQCFLITTIAAVLILSGCNRERHSDLWGSGILEATEVTISSLSNGTILEIRVDEGDRINQGEIVACIDTSDLVLQGAGLNAQLDEIDAAVRGIRLAAARAQEEFELARLTADRTKTLFDQGSATQQILDEAITRKNVSELTLQEIRNRANELDARRKNIQNALDQLQKKINDATIYAPASGTVINKVHEPGELIRYGERLLTIANTDTMWMKIYLKEEALNRVSLLAQTKVRVDAIGAKTLPGTVRWIASEAEFTPKNVETRESRAGLVYAIKIDVPNPDGILKIGMPAEAEILESR